MYKLLLLSLITFSPVSAMLTTRTIKTPVTRFLIQHRDSFTEVKRENVDPVLLGLNEEQLSRFSEIGYLQVSQLSDGEFKVRAFAKGKGGGPWAAWIAYSTTKTLCYGTLVAGAGTIAVTAAPAGLAAAVSSGAGGALLATAPVSAALGSTAVATAGVAGVIASNVVLTEVAVAGTIGVIAEGGAGLVIVTGGIEAVSAGVGAFFGAIPFLP